MKRRTTSQVLPAGRLFSLRPADAESLRQAVAGMAASPPEAPHAMKQGWRQSAGCLLTDSSDALRWMRTRHVDSIATGQPVAKLWVWNGMPSPYRKRDSGEPKVLLRDAKDTGIEISLATEKGNRSCVVDLAGGVAVYQEFELGQLTMDRLGPVAAFNLVRDAFATYLGVQVGRVAIEADIC